MTNNTEKIDLIIYDQSTKEIADAINRYFKYTKINSDKTIEKIKLIDLLSYDDKNDVKDVYYITKDNILSIEKSKANYETICYLRKIYNKNNNKIYTLNIKENNLFQILDENNEYCDIKLEFNLKH